MEAEVITARVLHGSGRAGWRCRKSGGVLCWGVFAPRAPPARAGAPGSGRARARGPAQEPTPRVDDSMHTDSGHPTALDTLTAPVTVLVGHFGAGKSEIAVNLAFGWRERGERGRRRGPRRREALLPLAPAPRRDAGARHHARGAAGRPLLRGPADRRARGPGRHRPGHGRARPRHPRRGRRRRRGAGARVHRRARRPGAAPTSSSSSTATGRSPSRPTPSSRCCARSNGSSKLRVTGLVGQHPPDQRDHATRR